MKTYDIFFGFFDNFLCDVIMELSKLSKLTLFYLEEREIFNSNFFDSNFFRVWVLFMRYQRSVHFGKRRFWLKTSKSIFMYSYVSPLSWNTELVYIANVNTPSFHAWLEVNNSDLECAARGAGSVDRMWSIRKEGLF